MNKGIIYCTKIREEYEGAHMEHMIAEKLLEIALKKEYGINLYNEPRAEGEHGKPFLSYRPSLHYNSRKATSGHRNCQALPSAHR